MSKEFLIEQLTNQLTSSFGATINLDMGEHGIVHIDGGQLPPIVTEGSADADGTIAMSLENFLALAKGELDPMGAFMDGTMSVTGDMGAIMALQNALSD